MTTATTMPHDIASVFDKRRADAERERRAQEQQQREAERAEAEAEARQRAEAERVEAEAMRRRDAALAIYKRFVSSLVTGEDPELEADEIIAALDALGKTDHATV